MFFSFSCCPSSSKMSYFGQGNKLFLDPAEDPMLNGTNNAKTRLDTFSSFPVGTPVRPDHLAEYGFVYAKVSDAVKCVFCTLMLSGWKTGDNPLVEHQKNSRHCPFIQGFDVGNIPLYDDPIRGLYPLLPCYDVCGNWSYKEQRPVPPKTLLTKFTDFFRVS